MIVGEPAEGFVTILVRLFAEYSQSFALVVLELNHSVAYFSVPRKRDFLLPLLLTIVNLLLRTKERELSRKALLLPLFNLLLRTRREDLSPLKENLPLFLPQPKEREALSPQKEALVCTHSLVFFRKVAIEK